MITDKDKARAFRMLVEEAREDLWAEEDVGELPERAKAGLESALATIRESTKAAAFRALAEEAADEEPIDAELPEGAKAALAKAQQTIADNTVKPDNVVDIRSARRGKGVWAGVGGLLGATAMAAGVVLYMAANNLEWVAKVTVDAGPMPTTTAHGLCDQACIYRGQAGIDYANGRFDECLSNLDKAKDLTLYGLESGDIAVLRQKCADGAKGGH